MARSITDFTQAAEALRPYYDNARTKYTLDVMHKLMEYLGSPQEKFRVLHVAGTSGKTSTAYYAAALLTAAGFKTGLTVSPHVDQLNERTQINMQPASEANFSKALSEFLDLVDASGITPSWFEAMVAFAYWYFEREQVDYAVIEVGLGGLHDGTNVITRADKVCIITDIGFDHVRILGNTLPEIAAQKAGIIQSGNIAFTYAQAPEIIEQLQTRATERKAILRVVDAVAIDSSSVQKLPLFQQRNLGLATTAVQYVLSRDSGKDITPEQVTAASQTVIPGRMEVTNYQGKTVILDGAHNGQKLTALFESVRVLYPNSKPLVLAAFVEGTSERWHDEINILVQNDVQLVLTDFYSEKDYKKFSVNPSIVADFCKQHGLDAEVVLEPAKAFEYVMSLGSDLVIVTGSFYLLNHIRPLIIKA